MPRAKLLHSFRSRLESAFAPSDPKPVRQGDVGRTNLHRRGGVPRYHLGRSFAAKLVQGAGTDAALMRFFCMTELPLHHLIEYSIQIAWDYLERTGELDNPEVAGKVLLDSIETMIRQGVRSRLLLSNRAITAYQRFKQERQAA